MKNYLATLFFALLLIVNIVIIVAVRQQHIAVHQMQGLLFGHLHWHQEQLK